MKVTTDLKSGSWAEDTLQGARNLGDQVGNFFYSAEQQAEGLTSNVANTANALWRDLTGFFGF